MLLADTIESGAENYPRFFARPRIPDHVERRPVHPGRALASGNGRGHLSEAFGSCGEVAHLGVSESAENGSDADHPVLTPISLLQRVGRPVTIERAAVA